MRHNNPSIAEDSVRIFNFKSGDSLGEINPVIQPIVQISPKINIIRSASATNATSGTIYATPTDKDFYVIGCMISHTRDVTATSTSSEIACSIDGLSRSLIKLNTITLTVGSKEASMSFTHPIKIDRNTNITVTNTTNTANLTTTGVIYGFTVEVVKGA